MPDSAFLTHREETQRVFEHHLSAFSQGIEEIMADYTESSVLVTPDASYVGLTRIREFFDAFLKSATREFWESFKVQKQAVIGNVAYLVFSAAPFIPMATDTLLVVDDKIAVQTFTPFST